MGKFDLKSVGKVVGGVVFAVILLLQESQIFSIKKNGGNELSEINSRIAQVETHVDNIYDLLMTVCVDKKD